MSDQLHDDQVEELEQETELQEEEVTGEVEEESSEEEDDDDSVVVTIGDEKPPAEDEEEKTAPKWVKDLRKQTKEQAKRIRELEAAAVTKASPEQKVPELGKKPAMEDEDIDWDAEKFEQRLTEWHDRKRQIEQEKAKAVEQQEVQQKEWQGRLDTYAKSKTDLKVRDFDDAESTVLSTLSVTQQGIIVQGADNSALVVYALGKNPAKAKELAGITDAVKFAFAIAKLETQLKVQAKSKSAPPPEGKVRGGNAPVSGSVDSNLERLRADAEKSGDYSKVTAYRRAQKEKQKA
jgi:hypothetical protein